MTIEKASAELSRAVKLCGTEATDPPSRRLAAGRLTAELENGQLRYVACDGFEAIRAIAFLVRDENWGTYTPQIANLGIKEGAASFAVSYRAVCADSRQRLVYEARISGSSDGSLVFAAVATPESDFITNRTGFVVLHPAGLAGQKVKDATPAEDGLDIGLEGEPVDRAVEHERRDHAACGQARDEGCRFPVAVRNAGAQALATAAAAVGSGHVGGRPGLVDEQETRSVKGSNPSTPPSS